MFFYRNSVMTILPFKVSAHEERGRAEKRRIFFSTKNKYYLVFIRKVQRNCVIQFLFL